MQPLPESNCTIERRQYSRPFTLIEALSCISHLSLSVGEKYNYHFFALFCALHLDLTCCPPEYQKHLGYINHIDQVVISDLRNATKYIGFLPKPHPQDVHRMQKDSDDEARVNLSHSCHTISHDNHMLVTLEPHSFILAQDN